MIFKYAKGGKTDLVHRYRVSDDLIIQVGVCVLYIEPKDFVYNVGMIDLFHDVSFDRRSIDTINHVENYFLSFLKDQY